jgi:hypothetical protein
MSYQHTFEQRNLAKIVSLHSPLGNSKRRIATPLGRLSQGQIVLVAYHTPFPRVNTVCVILLSGGRYDKRHRISVYIHTPQTVVSSK